MIISDLNKTKTEAQNLPKSLQTGLNWLKKADFNSLENKTYEIEGKDIFVIISEFSTKPIAETKAEVHEKYLDIQYIIKGEEQIGFGYRNEGNEILEAFNEVKDRTLFKGVVNEKFFPMAEGMFAIFYPSDVHRPNVQLNGECTVRKAVVKVALSAL